MRGYHSLQCRDEELYLYSLFIGMVVYRERLWGQWHVSSCIWRSLLLLRDIVFDEHQHEIIRSPHFSSNLWTSCFPNFPYSDFLILFCVHDQSVFTLRYFYFTHSGSANAMPAGLSSENVCLCCCLWDPPWWDHVAAASEPILVTIIVLLL